MLEWYEKRSFFYRATQNYLDTLAATVLKRNNENQITCVQFNLFT